MKTENPSPTISVMTATYNGEQVLDKLLDSLAAQDLCLPWEYIVVDNGSVDSTLEIVRSRLQSFPAPIRIVDGSARRHIPYVRNLGVIHARAEKLVFCDQDDVVQPGWLSAAHRRLDDEVAVMGLIRALTDPPIETARIMNPSVFTDRPVVETCNFGIRRSVLQEVGGFDENLPPYGLDDAELAIRLRKAGHHIAGAPEMVIHAMQTKGLRRRFQKVYASAKGEIYVWRKHDDIFGSQLNWKFISHELAQSVRSGVRYALGERDVPVEKISRSFVTILGHAAALLSDAELSERQ